jgi:hypothetical protein
MSRFSVLDASENKATGKADMENIEAQKERPELSKGRRYVYAGIFWFFAIGTLYTALFVAWRVMMGPLIIAGILHHYLIKKNNVAIFPYQAQVTTWLYTTRFYDRFVRRVKVDKEARVSRALGFWMFSWGCSCSDCIIHFHQLSTWRIWLLSGAHMKAMNDLAGKTLAVV